MDRRSFIKKTAAAAAGISIVPSHVLGGIHIAPSDTVYMAGIGVGGRGLGELMENLAMKAYQKKHLKPGKTSTDWAPYEYPGRTRLNWDGENMKITNYDPANQWVTRAYRTGWNI